MNSFPLDHRFLLEKRHYIQHLVVFLPPSSIPPPPLNRLVDSHLLTYILGFLAEAETLVLEAEIFQGFEL